MELTPLKSTNIAAAGFENGVLRVRYKDGAEYEYPNTSEQEHRSLMESDSPGRWMREFVSRRAGVVKVPSNPAAKREVGSDKFHTTQADGCCRKQLNNASLSGALHKAESFTCPRCQTEFKPTWHGPIASWEPQCDVMILAMSGRR